LLKLPPQLMHQIPLSLLPQRRLRRLFMLWSRMQTLMLLHTRVELLIQKPLQSIIMRKLLLPFLLLQCLYLFKLLPQSLLLPLPLP
jgi:hypothetical protein